MSETEMSPLELWNVSRQVAASAYRVMHEEESFEDAELQYQEWPFETQTDLETVVEDATVESRSETINTLQRVVNDRLKSTVETSSEGSEYDNRDVIHEWNRARSAATDLLKWVGGSSKDGDEYSELRDQHGELIPGAPGAAQDLLKGIDGDSYKDRHMELTRVLNASEVVETECVESEGTTSEDADSLQVEIASDLARVFIDRSEITYRDVMDTYDGVTFPARDVVMMEVMNSSGSTRFKRIEDIAEWVSTWCNDPSTARELSNQRPGRMGMASR